MLPTSGFLINMLNAKFIDNDCCKRGFIQCHGEANKELFKMWNRLRDCCGRVRGEGGRGERVRRARNAEREISVRARGGATPRARSNGIVVRICTLGSRSRAGPRSRKGLLLWWWGGVTFQRQGRSRSRRGWLSQARVMVALVIMQCLVSPDYDYPCHPAYAYFYIYHTVSPHDVVL